MNNGNFILEWMDHSTKHRKKHEINDLEWVLDQVVAPRIKHQEEFIYIFRLASTDPDGFIMHYMGEKMLQVMPSELPPGWWDMNSYGRFYWHLTEFLKAYAIICKVELRPDEVEPYLLEFRDCLA
jgi:hypothetical protein